MWKKHLKRLALLEHSGSKYSGTKNDGCSTNAASSLTSYKLSTLKINLCHNLYYFPTSPVIMKAMVTDASFVEKHLTNLTRAIEGFGLLEELLIRFYPSTQVTCGCAAGVAAAFRALAEFTTSAIDFLNRVGRTARAGQPDLVTSLYKESNHDLVAVIRYTEKIKDPVKLGEGVKGVYISVDLDCMDPAFAPGVSHIEPGGLSFRDVLNILYNLQADVDRADVVEFNPQCDTVDGMITVVAAKLVRELTAKISK
ncbi:Arginase 1, mitochondrial [Capsicum baccatum]|uniref:Arginase 1, mitochondrial n=1 Tax=Capsicum baccatum TaxID=33114 RepID=A0A2G2VN19_CAPBA|nr:Arginase 1, mitochondrial [Capsicum baccatum]